MGKSCLLLSWLALLAGCRLLADGAPCEVDENCLRSMRCEANRCVPREREPDEGTDAGRVTRDGGEAPDGGADDAGSDGGLVVEGDGGFVDEGDGGADGADGGCPACPPDGAVALWTFDEGAGAVVVDTAAFLDPLDLAVALGTEGVDWAWSSGAMRFFAPARVVSSAPGDKITDACNAAGAVTVEAWLTAANTANSGPARVVTLSRGAAESRNFTLGQEGDAWIVRLHTDYYPTPEAHHELVMPSSVTMAQQHVAFTWSAADPTMRLFIDGAVVAAYPVSGGALGWTSGVNLVVANEDAADRPWLGDVHGVAVFCRALDDGEIAARFGGGPP